MRSVKREDGWWIVDVPNAPDCGPYDSKREAEDDRRGMERFEKFEDRPGFVTVDRKRDHRRES